MAARSTYPTTNLTILFFLPHSILDQTFDCASTREDFPKKIECPHAVRTRLAARFSTRCQCDALLHDFNKICRQPLEALTVVCTFRRLHLKQKNRRTQSANVLPSIKRLMQQDSEVQNMTSRNDCPMLPKKSVLICNTQNHLRSVQQHCKEDRTWRSATREHTFHKQNGRKKCVKM